MKKIIIRLVVILLITTSSIVAQEKSAESFCKDGMEKINARVLSKTIIKEAIMDFEKALELNPKYKKAHLGLGLALYKKSLSVMDTVINEKLSSKVRTSKIMPLHKLWHRSIESFEKSGDLGKKNYDSREALLLMYKFLGREEEYLEIKKIKDSLNPSMIINRT